MNDADITKLAAKLTVSLATKEDIKDLKKDIKRLAVEIHILDKKADTILEFAEAVDETADKYGKRLRNIERIPIIAHELKNPAKI